MVDFEVNGFDEILQDLQEVEKEMPYAKDEVVKKSGRKFIKMCKDKTPYRAKDKKHIKNSYKLSEVQRNNNVDYVETTNTAPHFHLIERGHVQKNPNNMQETGFVQGFHMVERSADEFENEYPEVIEELVNKMIRKVNK